jgi:hypothetical protein
MIIALGDDPIGEIIENNINKNLISSGKKE